MSEEQLDDRISFLYSFCHFLSLRCFHKNILLIFENFCFCPLKKILHFICSFRVRAFLQLIETCLSGTYDNCCYSKPYCSAILVVCFLKTYQMRGKAVNYLEVKWKMKYYLNLLLYKKILCLNFWSFQMKATLPEW